MKNKIILLFSMAISTISFAQNSPSFGVKAGVVSAGLRGEALESVNKLLDLSNGMVTKTNNTGFFVGVNGTIPLSENISFESGIYYTQKGSQLNGNLNGKTIGILGTSVKSVFLANYIDMPLQVKADLGGLQLFAGPQISYLANAQLKTSAGILGINLLNNSIDATAVLNRWDAAITGGIGYQFQGGINLSASYDYGLLKADQGRKAAAYNQAFKIGIGINF